MREMKQMEAAEEGKVNQLLVQEEVLESKRGREPGPAVDLGYEANAVKQMNRWRAPAPDGGHASLAPAARGEHRPAEQTGDGALVG
jgi:hypothetical protein